MTAVQPAAARLPNTRLPTDQPARWYGLYGSAQALAILSAAEQHSGPVLLIARSAQQARVLHHDLYLLAAGTFPVMHFPDGEILPYDLYSPHPDIISERLAAMAGLPKLERGLVVVSVTTLMQRLPPADYILGHSISLNLGQGLKLDNFRATLLKAGYEATDQVVRPGQFAIRGNLLDLYPMGASLPYRIELFDEEIESIRSFDIDSQRSREKVAQIRLLPAREYPFDPPSIERFRERFRLAFDVDTRHSPLYQDLRHGLHPQGLESYLPLFFERTSSLFDYFIDAPVVLMQADLQQNADNHWQQVEERFEQRRHDIERPILPPDRLYSTWSDLQTGIGRADTVTVCDFDDSPGRHPARSNQAAPPTVVFSTGAAPELLIHDKASEPAAALKAYLDAGPQRKLLIAADSAGRREVILERLRPFELLPTIVPDWPAFVQSDAPFAIAVLPLNTGFSYSGPNPVSVITEAELFGGRIRQKAGRPAPDRDPESIIKDLTDLHPGAPVVHEDHGIGRYLGLQVLDIDDRLHEFLTLEYADGDKLYVPVAALGLISRYTGNSPENAPLHRLGGKQWENIKRRAAKRVRDVAAELLDLYAQRQSRKGHAFAIDARMYAEFCSTFAYGETADQQQAIDAVLQDLASPLPMDRVICGDVGFGKTEVALRAAFAAAQAGRQTALLVPTTLLAQQHYQTFSDRLADWPIRVEVLSRFRTGQQAGRILGGLKDGTVDIIIGTHRLIQRDIQFSSLGLVVIDEEQRFGVRQKERLKALRAEVDVLTLTATPIPRTLNMALSGIRDLSIIATPPARRMAVKTFVSNWNHSIIREALQRELQRGGQVYFLHNEVQTIEKAARDIEQLMPGARIRIAHGQMNKKELERVMLDFYRQRFNVLICTTIIESGIDVPSANTIIINRADKFGLAQLHQLRGRVGRSHHRAYAYLLIPDRRSITRDARKRLDAIESLEELGAGFTLATHDLEIRGAGELLGDDQSGQIQEIGFSLYTDLLNRAVASLKAGREPELDGPLNPTTDIDLHLTALIPDDYLPDVHLRLTLYKRIASARQEAELRELQVEMIDRFGLLPKPVKNLFSVTGIKLQSERLGIRRIDLGPGGGSVHFETDAAIDPAALIELIQQQARHYRLDGPQKLRILTELADGQQRIDLVTGLLQRIGRSAH